MTDTKVEEVRADELSLFDTILTTVGHVGGSLPSEVILVTIVGLRADNEDVVIVGHDGTEFACGVADTFHRVTATH